MKNKKINVKTQKIRSISGNIVYKYESTKEKLELFSKFWKEVKPKDEYNDKDVNIDTLSSGMVSRKQRS